MKRLILVMFILGNITAFAESTNAIKEETPKLQLKPNEPNHIYGAFKIGYVYQNLSSANIPLKNGENSYNFSSNNAYFGLERGWVGGPKKMLLIGGYLDAGAGDTYYLSAGGSFGLRLLDGWVIPKISLGYQMEHLGLPKDSDQYNIQSGVGTIGVFVNVIQGFGINLEARAGIPFTIMRGDQASVYGNPKFDMYQVMVSFSFFDFE
ncbi:hypothetical protein [Helicobacter cappadocius]|uniref:Outer membrane protein beta-barrel domain-containing protein n=1 Tax=Helicobacter cappadocius TaxID=3063998 RepID=A0AA90PTH2_9HELI|nr:MULTISPECIES: hypothetical protein [unclassified Helicobacter]MDO7253321.1 hypothetical protein [Helicobacter sp. faydin-H75]MDP2539249.1 hypothetical protein [Helicobacter sp. faydin-H76]